MNSPILNEKYLENNKQIYQYSISINYMLTGEITSICIYIWDLEIINMSVENKDYKIFSVTKTNEPYFSTFYINKTTLKNNDKPYIIIEECNKENHLIELGFATTPKQILQRIKIAILKMNNNSPHKYEIIEEYKKLCRKLILTLPKYGFVYHYHRTNNPCIIK